MKRLILTPNKEKVCGMYQIAKDLNGDIATLKIKSPLYHLFPLLDSFNFKDYDEVITLIYPMHLFGRRAKKKGKKWICYDMKVPEPKHFKGFWRRQYISLFYKLNEWSKKGANEYWDLSEFHPKPRYTKKKGLTEELRVWIKSRYGLDDLNYAIYIGRITDYKNYDWLKGTMKELKIPLVYPKDIMEMVRIPTDDDIHRLLSNAKILVTASEWEGDGRPVMEAQALGIPVVCFDVGTHKKNVKKGDVIENGNFKLFKEIVRLRWKHLHKGGTLSSHD